MVQKVRIVRIGEAIILSVGTEKRAVRFPMTEDEAQHLSNRLQSFAKGGFGSETVLCEGESR
jgi:hypothetical protein